MGPAVFRQSRRSAVFRAVFCVVDKFSEFCRVHGGGVVVLASGWFVVHEGPALFEVQILAVICG